MLFKFLSTLSLRRATYIGVAYIVAYIFLSTLSLRRATKAIIECNGGDPISIHALLAESDLPGQVCLLVVIPFLSTLSLRRATCPKASAAPPLMQFLSTLSLRRATTRPCMRRTVEPDFYPRSPCGERHYFCKDHYAAVSISIHALLAESDHPARHSTIPCGNFYPRSPCGERPSWASMFALTTYISIHALLAESDPPGPPCSLSRHTFLSTLSLRRATLPCCGITTPTAHFYPRSPCGERLDTATPFDTEKDISIHALLAESDPSTGRAAKATTLISIHALLAESDGTDGQNAVILGISIHALLAESDIGTLRTVSVRKTFLSTLSLRRATLKTPCVKLSIDVFLSTLSLRRATPSE